jgi:hypothetical protein
VDKEHKFSSFEKLFDMQLWQDEKGIETLLQHAETLHQALSYIETLSVLSKHASKVESFMSATSASLHLDLLRFILTGRFFNKKKARFSAGLYITSN